MSQSTKILIGVKAICKYLNEMDPKTLRMFFAMGLPHEVISRCVYAHVNNVEQFFEKITRRRGKADALDLDEGEV